MLEKQHDILIISGLSYLMNTKYSDVDPSIIFRESLKNLSRDTILLIQVKTLKWSPTNRSNIHVEGIPFNVSDLDLETTTRLQQEHQGTEKGRKRRKDNFVIAHF